MLRSIARSIASPLGHHSSGSNKPGAHTSHSAPASSPPRKRKSRRRGDQQRVPTAEAELSTAAAAPPPALPRTTPSSNEVHSSTRSVRVPPASIVDEPPDPGPNTTTTTDEPSGSSPHLSLSSAVDSESQLFHDIESSERRKRPISSSGSQLHRPTPPSLSEEQSVQTGSDLSVTTGSSPYPAALPTLRVNSDDIGVVMQRKVWVKRPGASATRVQVNDDDLIDNVRDVILHKYANSLGRSIDSPDITLKIVSREQANKNVPAERVLSPEENVGQTLDAYYPGGQSIDEALVIEVPQRRTPKPSPRPGNHHAAYYPTDEYRPGDGAREYFPPMPLHSPHLSHIQHPAVPNGALPLHSMSVLTTGQIPLLPSPGGHSARRHPRPKYGRQHTSSPTILHTSQSNGVEPKTQLAGAASTVPPLPTPPAQPDHKSSITPPNRTTSPHPNRAKKKKQTTTRDINGELPLPSKLASSALHDGRVPPINVLIVEDNVINLRLLEQFMRRLKVRWKTAMNGREAVNEWRQGGFHLVLMDIQLPVMNGLEATKEIRRLEGTNGIGLSVFGDGSPVEQKTKNGKISDEDKLQDRSLFKSPVIIVALTASSLQSDRHEALAVGCNDFLTKPVNFGWMERKVTEWGCMQALIDFDGWRKWKEIESKKEALDPAVRKEQEKEEKAKARAAMRAMFNRPPPGPAPARKEGSASAADSKSEEKKDESLAGKKEDKLSSTNQQPAATTSTNADHSRRSYRGRGSGSIGSLPPTTEVDEKSV